MRQPINQVVKIFYETYGYEKAVEILKQILNIYRLDYEESGYWYAVIIELKEYNKIAG